MNKIEKTIELDASLSKVWAALTDHRQFGEWFRVKLNGPFYPGVIVTGKITSQAYEHLEWKCNVVKMDKEKLFSFTWHPYSIDQTIDYSNEQPTLVQFALESSGEKTVLTITESGFEHLPAERRSLALRMNDGGWTEQVKNIKAYLSR